MLAEHPLLIKLASGAVLHTSGAERTTPVLLFFHGVGGGAWSWKSQRDAFASSYRVFLWEARGHGAAARVADAGLSDYYVDAKEALAAVVEETGRPPLVIAHSMGGLLAIALAADDPAAVEGLFLIDPVYATGDEGAGHFSPAMGAFVRFLCSPLLRSFERDGMLSRRVARWMFERSFEDRTRMEAAWRDQRRQIPFEYPRMLRESFVRPTGFPLRDFARDVSAPTFLLERSGNGGKARFPALIETLQERLGASFRYESLAGGHYLQCDRPQEVNERLGRFIEFVRQRRASPL